MLHVLEATKQNPGFDVKSKKSAFCRCSGARLGLTTPDPECVNWVTLGWRAKFCLPVQKTSHRSSSILLLLPGRPSLSSTILYILLFPLARPSLLPSSCRSLSSHCAKMGFEDGISHDATDNSKVIDADGEKKVYAAPPPFEGDMLGEMSEAERDIYDHGIKKFSRLGWKRLTVVLIVEAVALGCLSIPSTFATLGMVAGVICCIGLGLVAIYTSYIVGQVKLAFPQVSNYADAGQLMGSRTIRLVFRILKKVFPGITRFADAGESIGGRFGYEVVNLMLALQLIFLTGSHCLTGTIAFMNITESDICAVIFGVVSAIILLLLAVPPSFTEVAILGYIDFASIICAIGITIIGTGVTATNSPGGLAAVNWSAWPKPDITFTEGFIAVSNIIFAYSFAMCQFSFMDEMHTPKDFVKSIWALGLTEIVVYTLTGALVYAFVGQEVSSPALTSAGHVLSRVAYGVALPVIFISGSINTVVFGRLVHGRIFAKSPIRFINTTMGWLTWLGVISAATVIAFVIAEVIPFFSDLLSISSALFISGFTFYFPAIMWFLLIRKGGCFEGWNIVLTITNLGVLIIGLITLVAGTYSSVEDIVSLLVFPNVPGHSANPWDRSITTVPAMCVVSLLAPPLNKQDLASGLTFI